MIQIALPSDKQIARIYSLLQMGVQENIQEIVGESVDAQYFEDDETLPKTVKLGIGPVELADPLSVAFMYCERNVESHSLVGQIYLRNPDCLNDMTPKFEKRVYMHEGLTFYPTSKDLTGYLLNDPKEKYPLGVIVPDEANTHRAIGFGKFGARHPVITNTRDLKVSLNRTIAYMNDMLSVVYEQNPLPKNSPDIILSFPDV